MNIESRSRRRFLTDMGGSLGAGWVAVHWPAIAAAHAHAATSAGGPVSSTLDFLSEDDARDVDAIAAQIIPTDDTPGARESGAVFFIDRSLNTWASAAAAPFRSGLAQFQARFGAAHPATPFATAPADVQFAFLTQVEQSEFFRQVRFLTLLGLFASPRYGGNRGGIGWQLIGFDDSHAFSPPFGHYDRDYPGFALPDKPA